MLLLRQFMTFISGGLVPPEGFAFVTSGGDYVVDGGGSYVVTEI